MRWKMMAAGKNRSKKKHDHLPLAVGIVSVSLYIKRHHEFEEARNGKYEKWKKAPTSPCVWLEKSEK
jgi:hypothetical protein